MEVMRGGFPKVWFWGRFSVPSHSCFSGLSDFGVGRTSCDLRKMIWPKVMWKSQRVACERYRSQTVSVTRIEVSGSTLATH